MTAIPKIIHQSYKTVAHPYSRVWQDSWRTNHPSWSYRFHTDKDNRSLVENRFPEFLPSYDSFPYDIMRADFARFLYLYIWGGLYVDLDYVSLKPADALLKTIESIGIPSLEHNGYYRYHNALLASEPRNTFWLHCAHKAIAYFNQTKQPRVELLAGPLCIQNTIADYSPNFTELSEELVTPIDWYSLTDWGKPNLKTLRIAQKLRDADITAMQAQFPNAYALTFWNHGWSEAPILVPHK